MENSPQIIPLTEHDILRYFGSLPTRLRSKMGALQRCVGLK